jgi:segregation and condensation protein A
MTAEPQGTAAGEPATAAEIVGEDVTQEAVTQEAGAQDGVAQEGAAQEGVAEAMPDEQTFVIDVDGFEGPLDLLLTLARQQKVDLTRISILALADQYLAFVEEARRLRLELAADYLVMAAWLAFLKSRLLLPDLQTPEGGQTAEEMANALALRLKRLEAIREASERLMARPQLDRDVFARGQPEPIAHIRKPEWSATLFDLLSAYARQRQKNALSHVRMAKRAVWSLTEARETLERLIGQTGDWTRLDAFLLKYAVEPSHVATVFASSFASMLELVRDGRAEIHQDGAFAPLYMRKRQGGVEVATESGGAAPAAGTGN